MTPDVIFFFINSPRAALESAQSTLEAIEARNAEAISKQAETIL